MKSPSMNSKYFNKGSFEEQKLPNKFLFFAGWCGRAVVHRPPRVGGGARRTWLVVVVSWWRLPGAAPTAGLW